jgi:hypothetical protein
MITITYKCDETGQEATITVEGIDNEHAEVSFQANPPINEGVLDPYGILGSLEFAILNSSRGEESAN